MSRIGKLPIAVPAGVTITVDNDFVTVTSSKGTLQQFMMSGINVAVKDNTVTVSRISDEREHRARGHAVLRDSEIEQRWKQLVQPLLGPGVLSGRV